MKKQPLTVRLDVDVLDRIRNVVYWTPGLTMNSFLEEAVMDLLKATEEKKGGAFPRRDRQLQAGRKIEL